MEKYNLSFFLSHNGIPDITTTNEKNNFICSLSIFRNINQIEHVIIPKLKNANPTEEVEWMSPIESFIRLNNGVVIFGQYVDENLATLNQFKDYLDEGEKIMGTIPSEDFLEIIKNWVVFLKRSDTKVPTLKK